jgi:ubiquinone/menaquinone biosynthesis C-methylase UbiE
VREPHPRVPSHEQSPFGSQDVVARYEEWYATPWGRLVDRLQREMLVDLLRPLDAGAAVLEVGCGTGHFAHALRGRGFRVVGVDPAPAMLAVAATRVPVACADGQRLPFRDGAFDAVMILAVLEFAQDPRALLAEALRVARERVVVFATERRSWLGLRRRLHGRLGHPVFSRATYRTRAEIAALVRAAGGEVERSATALFLPPALGGRLPRLEESLARRALPFGGVLAMSMARTRWA